MTSYAEDLNRVVTAVLKARQAEVKTYRMSSAIRLRTGKSIRERFDTPLDHLCDAVLDGVEPFVLPDDAPPDTDEIDMTELTPRQRFHQLRASGVPRYQAAKALGIAPSSVYAWEDKDGNPIEAKRSYTKRATAEPEPAPAPAPAPVDTPPPQQMLTTSPAHTHQPSPAPVSDTATMIAQMNALRASLIAKRDELRAQVAEINEALGEG
jgi:DNA-binding XRE family transcriptional regulator